MSFFGLNNVAFLGAISKGGFDYVSDFSVNNWTEADSSKIGVDTVGETMDWEIVRDTTNDAAFQDILGGTISDTAWLYRTTFNITSITNGSSNKQGYWGFSSTSAAANTSQDFLGLIGLVDGAGAHTYHTTSCNNQNQDAGTQQVFTRIPSVELIFVEEIRSSATVFTCEQFSDSDYTSSLESQNVTTSSAVTALRFLKISNLNSGSSVAGNLIGDSNLMQFADGVTTAP